MLPGSSLGEVGLNSMQGNSNTGRKDKYAGTLGKCIAKCHVNGRRRIRCWWREHFEDPFGKSFVMFVLTACVAVIGCWSVVSRLAAEEESRNDVKNLEQGLRSEMRQLSSQLKALDYRLQVSARAGRPTGGIDTVRPGVGNPRPR